MAFKSPIWFPIAVVLSGLNLAAAGYHIALAESMQAAVHTVFAVAFGWWAYSLRQRPTSGSEYHARFYALEVELGELRQELSELRPELNEAQERLDFAERLLAQGSESRRAGPEP